MTAISHGINRATGTFVSPSPVVKSLALAVAASFVVQFVASDESYESASVFSGVFDLLSIFTGFLATFYVFIVTKGNEFLEKIKTTATYRMVLKLLKFTILWSVFMIMFSYALMVIDPREYSIFSAMSALVFFWLANIILIAVNFGRCVNHFLTIVEAGDIND